MNTTILENINTANLIEYDNYLQICWDEYCQILYKIALNANNFDLVNKNTKYTSVLTHVHYLMQNKIENFLDMLNQEVENFSNCKLILFGSSSNALCTEDSDIDIAFLYYGDNVEKYNFQKRLFYLCHKVFDKFDTPFDLVDITHAEGNIRLINAIERGVVLWDKKI